MSLPTAAAPPALAARLRGVASSPVRDLLALIDRPGVLSFAGGLPAPELFDAEGLRAAYDRVLSGPAARRSLQYAPTEGDLRLRALVAERLTRRGLTTTPGDLLVTTGSQQALTLLATALLDPGSVVAVESPTYLAALQTFQLTGATLVPVASDSDGIDPDDLGRVLAEHRPTLLYLVPTFANPTGRTVPAERRRQIAELAADAGVWVVEDDPYGELRFSGNPIAPLAAEPAVAGTAIHLGSFSKIGAPGLRLGWVRAPERLLPALTVAKQAADLHTSTIDQAAAAEYLACTDLDRHVAGLCTAYRARRDAMLAALPDTLPPGSTWSEPDGGMFVWARLESSSTDDGPDRRRPDTATLLPAALAAQVAFVPGAPFFAADPDPATMRLSFTTHTPDEIVEGLRRLASVVRPC
jgi:DNA-binding transcriptional MocR family regulator